MWGTPDGLRSTECQWVRMIEMKALYLRSLKSQQRSDVANASTQNSHRQLLPAALICWDWALGRPGLEEGSTMRETSRLGNAWGCSGSLAGARKEAKAPTGMQWPRQWGAGREGLTGSRLCMRRSSLGISLAVQWLGLCTSTAEGTGSIPAWGTMIPHAVWLVQKDKDCLWLVRCQGGRAGFWEGDW